MPLTPDNILPLLLEKKSELKSSFKGFSDEQLRLGLMQIIDGLERMDELSSLVEDASKDWRRDSPQAKSTWVADQADYASTAIAVQPTQTPWAGYQVSDLSGKQCDVADMSRKDLEAAIRVSWCSLERFQGAAILLQRDASRILSGEWIQDEGNKPVLDTKSPARRRSP